MKKNLNKDSERKDKVSRKRKSEVLFIVVPCFNEEEVLPETNRRLNEKLADLVKKKKVSNKSKILYVDDGSTDQTWNLILAFHRNDKNITGISLSQNRGHQNALTAGLLVAKKYADVVISIDADLQDDVNAIDEMLEKYFDGNDIVYGVRSERKEDHFLKRKTAEWFYKILEGMKVRIVYNHADYRLTSKRVLDEFENFREVNLFLRGIFPIIGFKSDKVYYKRTKRFAGKSKYTPRKMMSLAWNGITSFSDRPIGIVLGLGVILFVVNLIASIVVFVMFMSGRNDLGIMLGFCLILTLLGLNLLAIGIVGEYVGKTYLEVKRRPRFTIRENLLEEDSRNESRLAKKSIG